MNEPRWDISPLMKSKGMSVARICAFAEAAADFWTAGPWRHFKGETAWEIWPTPKTRAMGACVVVGFSGDAVGIGFLNSSFELYELSQQTTVEGQGLTFLHTFWSVHFLPEASAPQTDAALWTKERLPLASSDAFAIPYGTTRWGKELRPSTVQLNLMEALLRAFATITPKEAAGPTGTRMTRSVKTFDGQVNLTLTIGASIEPTDPLDPEDQ